MKRDLEAGMVMALRFGGESRVRRGLGAHSLEILQETIAHQRQIRAHG